MEGDACGRARVAGHSPIDVLDEWRRSSSRKKLPRWSMSAKNCHQVIEYGKKALNIVAAQEKFV